MSIYQIICLNWSIYQCTMTEKKKITEKNSQIDRKHDSIHEIFNRLNVLCKKTRNQLQLKMAVKYDRTISKWRSYNKTFKYWLASQFHFISKKYDQKGEEVVWFKVRWGMNELLGYITVAVGLLGPS